MEENACSHLSSSMPTEIHFFHTKSWQREPNVSVEVEIPSGTLVIRFILYKRIGSRRFDTLGDITYDDPAVLVNKGVVIDPSYFLSDRGMYTEMIIELISSSMPDVPEDEHPDIIGKTFEAVEGAVLGLPIDIVIVDTTIRLLGCARTVEEYHLIVGRVTMDFMHISKRIAAAKLSIDGLEKVALDSLDLSVRQTPCIICREDLDHIDVVEGRIVHPVMITRLPCSHLYHGDCIVGWLLMSHLCPLCRYPIPVVKVPCELPILEVTAEGPILEGVGEGPIGEVTDEQPIVEVAGERPIVEVAGERPIVEVAREQQTMEGPGELQIVEVANELPVVEVASEGPIVEVTDEQPIVEVAGEQPIVEVAGEQPIVDVADERSKTSRQVDWPMLLKMSAGGVVTGMLLCKLLKWH